MAGLTPTQMVDLVLCVRDNYPPDQSFEYLRDSTVHSFELLNRVFTKDKVQIQGGEYISRFVNYRETGTAQFVNPAQTYEPSIEATMTKLTIPWRHAHADWSVIREELLAYRGPERLANFLKARRQATQMDLALVVEKQFFAAPDSTSDVTPLTIPYYIVPITTTQVSAGTTLNGAFQGQNPTGYSDVASIDPSDATYARWRNWNAVSDNATGAYTDTIGERLGKMFRHLNFEAPVTVADLEKPAFQNKRFYVNETTLMSMQQARREQNDQLGNELNPRDVFFNSMPPVWIQTLDTYSAVRGYYPMYLINFSALFPIVRSGDFFRSETFPADKYQPDVTTTHIDLSYNLLCENRQMVGGVISYVA